MKQSELNKLLNVQLKQTGKTHGWKSSSGFIFKATETLFFSLVATGQAKKPHLSYSLGYKMLAFDDLFWKIVKLEENRERPLSFRANGAWTFPTTEITKGKLPIADWTAENLQHAVDEIMARCDREAEKISGEAQDLDANLRAIESLYLSHKEEHPESLRNIWRERALTLILKKEYREAERMVRDRISSHDGGGFMVGPQGFYDLANEYLQKLL